MSTEASVSSCTNLAGMGTYLPHSRMTRDCPICTAIRLPNALKAMSRLKTFTPLALPNTLVKNRLATVTPDDLMSCFGTEVVVSTWIISPDCIDHTSRKVSNICEQVKHRYNYQRVRCVPLDGFHRILRHISNLSHNLAHKGLPGSR